MKSCYAQNGVNGSSVKTEGPFLLCICFKLDKSEVVIHAIKRGEYCLYFILLIRACTALLNNFEERVNSFERV